MAKPNNWLNGKHLYGFLTSAVVQRLSGVPRMCKAEVGRPEVKQLIADNLAGELKFTHLDYSSGWLPQISHGSLLVM